MLPLKVAALQISPVFLDRQATTQKIIEGLEKAAACDCKLVALGETILPAYPLWLCRTDGARFEADDQKELHAAYLEQAVVVEDGHLDSILEVAGKLRIAVVLGIAERASDRGSHTIYCSRVFITSDGRIGSIHRKLVPTYEERLTWGNGDGAGLVTHRVGPFTVGALNCWENWMPLARAALYAAGEDLHIMLWPGSQRLTRDLTRFVARESRSYVISACGLIREQDLPADLPHRDRMCEPGETFYDGGSCIAGPDGQWIVEPVTKREELVVADIDPQEIFRERQNFDPAGHYSRPDVLRLVVDRRRQTTVEFTDEPAQ